ncbi:keratin-associated protein 5-1-like [Dreissena polymorpha]|uniref:Uncharacterized protein n=1 Tax=Dreissena polymorpha TaxID=45954 RepID=A0A9D4C7M6_DREPO|nr:keratin-associated protein 5-1-like [Dreissena polymorpha]KAH3718961.1 hypothetical protein DPMN_061789 [Dreissena polymorpha]
MDTFQLKTRSKSTGLYSGGKYRCEATMSCTQCGGQCLPGCCKMGNGGNSAGMGGCGCDGKSAGGDKADSGKGGDSGGGDRGAGGAGEGGGKDDNGRCCVLQNR